MKNLLTIDELFENTASVKFNKGDVVWDDEHKCYGQVLDNFGNAENGDRGDIRLDSDGMVAIFKKDGSYNLKIQPEKVVREYNKLGYKAYNEKYKGVHEWKI